MEETKATQKIDKVCILNNIAFPRLGTCDLETPESHPPEHPNFQKVDEALASHFALASWHGYVQERKATETLARALSADTHWKSATTVLHWMWRFLRS